MNRLITLWSDESKIIVVKGSEKEKLLRAEGWTDKNIKVTGGKGEKGKGVLSKGKTREENDLPKEEMRNAEIIGTTNQSDLVMDATKEEFN